MDDLYHVRFFKEISYTFYFTGVYTSKDTADALPILYTLLYFNDYSTTYIQEEILDQLDFTKMIFLPSKITDQLTISTFKKLYTKALFIRGLKYSYQHNSKKILEERVQYCDSTNAKWKEITIKWIKGTCRKQRPSYSNDENWDKGYCGNCSWF